jgi:hypothetical protein
MNKIADFFNHPWYGNYVGPGNNPGMPPIGNGLDQAAQMHDMAYGSLGAKGGVWGAVFDFDAVKVDWEFVIRAFAAIGSERTWQSKAWAVGTTVIFGTISIFKTIITLLVVGTLSFIPLFFPDGKDNQPENVSDIVFDKIDKIMSTSDTSGTGYETDMGSVVLAASQNTNLSNLEDSANDNTRSE